MQHDTSPHLACIGGIERKVHRPPQSRVSLRESSPEELDNIHAVAIKRLRSKLGALASERWWDVERALGFALDIDRLKG